MEIFDWVYSQINTIVYLPYMVSFMLLAYLFKKYFSDALLWLTFTKWKTVYTVLILAAVLAIPFILFAKESWEKILVSYCVGTSLHELLFAWIEKKFAKE